MKEITAGLTYQLNCAFQTACKTQTGLSAQSWIASVLPADDSLKHIKRIQVNADISLPEEELTKITISPSALMTFGGF